MISQEKYSIEKIMGILTVSSTNPQFSFIIQKNPETILTSKQPFKRTLRKGTLYGWFTSPKADKFRLLFQDSDIDTSFGNEEFEYLDLTRYASPQLPISMITEALRTASMKIDEHDVAGFEATCQFSIMIKYRVMSRLIAMFGDGRMQAENLNDNVEGPWKVTLKAPTVNEVLNLTVIISVLGCLADDSVYIPLKEDGVRKYLRTLLAAKAPYYIWHLFSSRAITSRGLFTNVKEDLDKSGFALNYGNTQIHRFDAIQKALEGTGTQNLTDIGCGEMFQSLRLAGKRYDFIHAIEADKDIAEGNVAKINNRELTDVLSCINAEVDAKWVEENPGIIADGDVLLTEVLEHISMDKAQELLRAVCQSDANVIVVTVPCGDFNVHYGLDATEIRHPDHKWEPTFELFSNFVLEAEASSSRTSMVQYLGDSVGGVGASLIAVISAKKVS